MARTILRMVAVFVVQVAVLVTLVYINRWRSVPAGFFWAIQPLALIALGLIARSHMRNEAKAKRSAP